MHRHHPYGGSGYDERRRSASPGPRFPRNDRGGPRGGGFGRGGAAPRGRGRGGGGPPYSGSGYSNYDSGPSYDSYNQPSYNTNSGYGAGGYSSYNAPAPQASSYGRDGSYDSYAQGYGSNSYEEDAWREDDRGGPPRRRRDRDDRQHDAIIEDRINRERPCRTLFVRNIKYESDSSVLRRQFEEHGLIRTFFDLISSRGMLFVTYYDLRAAQAARDRLQGMEVNGRPIDVHYSLPRPEETEGRVDREKHQGTLLVTLRDSRMPIDENEIQRKFSQFGDIKNIRPVDGRSDQRLVEMYDTRATEQIYEALRQQPLQDGNMDLEWAWDVLGDPVTDVVLPPQRYRGDDTSFRDRPPRGTNRGRGFGGRGGRGGYDDHDRRDRSDDYNYGPSSSRDDYDDRAGSSRGGGRGIYRGGPPGRVNGDRGGFRSPNRQGSRDYSRNEQQPFNAGAAPPPPPGSAADQERLEQARKVQQLLAALKNPADAAAAAQGQSAVPSAASAPRPAFVPTPNASYNPHPSSGSFATPPPTVTPGWNPSPSGGAPPTFPPPPPGNTAALGQLPPAVLALLQQTAQQQQQPQAPPSSAPPYFGGTQAAAAPPPTSYGTPQPPSGSVPNASSGPTAPGVQNPQAMQHLLALLAAQQKR